MSKLTIYLQSEWKDSLARIIWEDLTPLGRLTLWVPVWFVCWLGLLAIVPLMSILMFLDWLSRKLPQMPSIFFK